MKQTARFVWNKIEKANQIEEQDTALMFYSLPHLKRCIHELKMIFGHKNTLLHTVAIKTNPHPKILHCIGDCGLGLEAASFEEVVLARQAGIKADKIIFNSPVKTKREIKKAAQDHPGIFINANSLEELKRFPKDAKTIKAGLRINPCIDPGTNNLFNVSTIDSKFGVPLFYKEKILKAILDYPITALHIHVGSQVTNLKETVEGIKTIYRMAKEANQLIADSRNRKHPPISVINIGGGIPAGKTDAENQRNMRLYATLLQEEIPQLFKEFKVITEFGQWIHRLNGISFSRVEYVRKLAKDKEIAYIHLGGDMFPREIYTDTNYFHYEVLKPNHKPQEAPLKTYNIAGPLCYNGDFLVKDINLPQMHEGDILAIHHTGANTFGLWSRHCSRSIPKFVTDIEKGEGIDVLSERIQPFNNF